MDLIVVWRSYAPARLTSAKRECYSYRARSFFMQSTLDATRTDVSLVWSPGSKEDLARFRKHLAEIVQSAEFRSSPRSAQFLRYICEQALTGHPESLKERSIGVELFGRSAAYDTGEDSIVRVTASDVRKRLSHFYLSSPGS